MNTVKELGTDKFSCVVEGITNSYTGSKMFLFRRFDGSGDLYSAALTAILRRYDRGLAFLGCELTIKTPVTEIKVILEDDWGRRILKNEKNEVLAEESHA